VVSCTWLHFIIHLYECQTNVPRKKSKNIPSGGAEGTFCSQGRGRFLPDLEPGLIKFGPGHSAVGGEQQEDRKSGQLGGDSRHGAVDDSAESVDELHMGLGQFKNIQGKAVGPQVVSGHQQRDVPNGKGIQILVKTTQPKANGQRQGGENELQKGSRTRPAVLKADSEATMDTGIARTCHAT